MEFLDDSIVQILKIYVICIICFFNLKYIDRQFDPNKWLNLILRVFLTVTATYLYYSAMPQNAALYNPTTMIQACLVGIPTVKSIQFFLFSDTKTRRKLKTLQYLLSFVYPMVQVSKIPKHELLPFNIKSIIQTIITNTLPLLFLSYQSIICTIYFQKYLNQCLNDKEKVNIISNNYLYLSYYSSIQLITVLSGICTQNALYAMVTLLTLNRYKWLEMNNYPLFSISIGELWSKRYNQLIRTIMHQSIFTPAIKYGISKPISALLSFLVSGVMHVYIAYKTFGHGLLSTVLFFVFHGIATVIESFVYGKDKHYRNRDKLSALEIMIRISVTMTFFVFTAPLYIGLFIGAYPEWGKHAGIEQGSSIYGINQIIDMMPSVECYYPR